MKRTIQNTTLATLIPYGLKPLALQIGLILASGMAHAEVVTDGSLGTAQTLNKNGSVYAIEQSMGTLSGNNLYHSFQTFNLTQGEIAQFKGADTITNVISRVTGGSASSIDGRIESQIGTADFYFINPAGVVFGKNASVAVPAAFHVSTANELRFNDGSVFSATPIAGSSLSAAQPESFGFLGAQSGDITFTNSNISVHPIDKESRSSITANNITVTDSLLTFEGGKLRLRAQGTAATGKTANGTVTITGKVPESSLQTGNVAASTAEIRLRSTENLSTGDIDLIGGDVVLDGGKVINDTSWSQDAGRIIIDASNSVTMKNRGTVSSDTFGSGNAGEINIKTGTLTMDGATVRSNTSGAGNAGYIQVDATTAMTMDNSSWISSDALGNSSGRAGGVAIKNSKSLSVNNSRISSVTSGQGDAGDINIQLSDALQISNSSRIVTSNNPSFFVSSDGTQENIVSAANAGLITIQAGGISVDNSDISSDTNGSGYAGKVALRATGGLTVTNGAWITSDVTVTGSGSGGEVQIIAGSIDIDNGSIRGNTSGAGNAGLVTVESSGQLRIANSGWITSDALNGSGKAGLVTVKAKTAVIESKGRISSITTGSGDAGDVVLGIGESVTLSGEAQITTSNSPSFHSSDGTVVTTITNANAGNIAIATRDLSVNGGTITSETYGGGIAGTVKVDAAGAVTVSNSGRISSNAMSNSSGNAGQLLLNSATLQVDASAVVSNTFGTGRAGNVAVTVQETATVANKGWISSDSINSSGKAGLVNLTAKNVVVNSGARISSIASGSGDAGDVSVVASESTTVIDGAKITTSNSPAFHTADGVEITVVSNANAGNVALRTNSLLLENGGSISSDTFNGGNAGSVTIDTNTVTITGQVQQSPQDGGFSDTGIFSKANDGSTGAAGSVYLSVSGAMSLSNRGRVTTSTYSTGNAGDVTVTAGTILLSDNGNISSSSDRPQNSSGGGNAGNITLTTTSATSLRTGGNISSSSATAGKAGYVLLTAPQLLISGESSQISSQSLKDSTNGEAGSITINADNVTMDQRSKITVATLPTVTVGQLTQIIPAKIAITAKALQLQNGSTITAQSEGNVSAGDIVVTATDSTLSGGGSVTTKTRGANAGAITFTGDKLYMRDGIITTSVDGVLPALTLASSKPQWLGVDTTTFGKGGDIRLATKQLTMNGAFIQANTAVQGASGGNILVQTDLLLANGGVEVGKLQRANYISGVLQNVIQAASPGGEQGQIDIVSPDVNISGSLAQFSNRYVQPVTLASSPCSSDTANQSSLVEQGRGGVARLSGVVASVPVLGKRLYQLLHSNEGNVLLTPSDQPLPPLFSSDLTMMPCYMSVNR